MMFSPSSVVSPCGRLCLGSVSSLSFEEEEHDNDHLGDNNNHAADADDDRRDEDGHGPQVERGAGRHELHDLLTNSLMEQVGEKAIFLPP